MELGLLGEGYSSAGVDDQRVRHAVTNTMLASEVQQEEDENPTSNFNDGIKHPCPSPKRSHPIANPSPTSSAVVGFFAIQ